MNITNTTNLYCTDCGQPCTASVVIIGSRVVWLSDCCEAGVDGEDNFDDEGIG